MEVYLEPDNDIGSFIAKLSLFLSVVTLLTLSAGLHPLLCLWNLSDDFLQIDLPL